MTVGSAFLGRMWLVAIEDLSGSIELDDVVRFRVVGQQIEIRTKLLGIGGKGDRQVGGADQVAADCHKRLRDPRISRCLFRSCLKDEAEHQSRQTESASSIETCHRKRC